MNPFPDSFTALKLDIPFGKIHAVRNQNRNNKRLLLLHGWLDNCASFTPLLPYLNDYECVAIDITGHGKSTHRAGDSSLHFIDYIRDIQQVIDALGWKECHLIGHSMGGAIGLLCASAIPNYISSLTMIDALQPLTREPAHAPTSLQKSISQFYQWDAKRERIFSSLDEAVNSRLRASPYFQSYENAELLMLGATEKTPKGYRLRSDGRLGFRSPLMLDQSQADAFIQDVEQPVLAILASDGLLKNHPAAKHTLGLFNSIVVKKLSGGHHIHMEHPKQVSQLIKEFIDEQ